MQNKDMFDIRSRLVLKILVKECPCGAYKVIEASDVISLMPPKYRVDFDGLEYILTFLERQDCISIKYNDDETYCLSVLPSGNEILENDSKKKEIPKAKKVWPWLIIFFIVSFIGAFLGAMLVKFII